DPEGQRRAAAHDLGARVDVGDVLEDRGMELDVLEGLHRTRHRDLALGGAVGVVERGSRCPPLGDTAQVLDRQRVLQTALLRVELELLELHQIEDLGRLGDLPLDHGVSLLTIAMGLGGCGVWVGVGSVWGLERCVGAGRCQAEGTIQDRTVDWSPTSRHITTSIPSDHQMTRRKIDASLPSRPTAVAAIVRFCGLIILPTTPPELLAPTSSSGLRPASCAAVCCSVANRALAEVSEPVTAVPSQPRIGERKAKKAPVPAIQVPIVMVCPDRFMT